MRVRTIKLLFDEVEPVEVLLVATVTDVGVALLQCLGDRTGHELTSVDLAYGDDLRCTTRQEDLVGGVEVHSIERRLVYRGALVGSELHHGLTCDPGQWSIHERRRMDLAVPHDEDVL